MGLGLFFQGYLDLSTHRQSGFAVGWIPVGAIFDYCERMGLQGEQREYFVDVMKRLDSQYLKWQSEKKSGKQPGSVWSSDGTPGRKRR